MNVRERGLHSCFSGLDVNLLEREAAEGSEVNHSSAATAASPRPLASKHSNSSTSGGSAGVGGVDEAKYIEQQRSMVLRRGDSLSPLRPTSASSGQQTPTAAPVPLDQLLSTPSFEDNNGESLSFIDSYCIYLIYKGYL